MASKSPSRKRQGRAVEHRGRVTGSDTKPLEHERHAPARPSRKASAKPLQSKPSKKDDTEVAKAHRRPHWLSWSAPAQWVTCAFIVMLHISAVQLITSATQSNAITLIALLVPGIVATATLDASRQKWWRWILLVALVTGSVPPNDIVIVLVGETWLVHRCWLVESSPEYQPPLPPKPSSFQRVTGWIHEHRSLTKVKA